MGNILNNNQPNTIEQFRALAERCGATIVSTLVGLFGLRKIKVFWKGCEKKGVANAVRWFGRSRNYRSFAAAIRKVPARKRFTGVVLWGARCYAVQQVSSYVINRTQNRYRR